MRFKLKTDFLTFAREQIRGGLWYKPAWWDAVSKVPPTHFQPRIPKKDVPTIRLLEDQLLRKFKDRNPSISALDKMSSADAKAAKPVSSAFVEKQLEIMRGKGKSEDEAYQLTQAWLLKNGKQMFSRLNVSADVKATLEITPSNIADARTLLEHQLKQQLDEVRRALKSTSSGRPRAADLEVRSGGYRQFTPSADLLQSAHRLRGQNPVEAELLGNVDYVSDNDDAGSAAAGVAGASSSSSSSPSSSARAAGAQTTAATPAASSPAADADAIAAKVVGGGSKQQRKGGGGSGASKKESGAAAPAQ